MSTDDMKPEPAWDDGVPMCIAEDCALYDTCPEFTRGTCLPMVRLMARPDEPKAPDAPDTVRVRVAVCVMNDGGWAARGDSDTSDESAQWQAEEAVQWEPLDGVPHTITYIEADIPLPKPATVAGEVVD